MKRSDEVSHPRHEPYCPWCEQEAHPRVVEPVVVEVPQKPVLDPYADGNEPDDECVDTLGPFSVGDCVRLTALPLGLLEDLDEWERPDYRALVGQRFDIVAMMAPNIVSISCDRPGPNGEPGWEVFTMPLELLEAAEWEAESEEDGAGPS